METEQKADAHKTLKHCGTLEFVGTTWGDSKKGLPFKLLSGFLHTSYKLVVRKTQEIVEPEDFKVVGGFGFTEIPQDKLFRISVAHTNCGKLKYLRFGDIVDVLEV